MCLCIYFLFFYGIIRKNLRLSKFHTCFANSSQPLGFHLARQLGSPEEHLSSVKFSVVLIQFLIRIRLRSWLLSNMNSCGSFKNVSQPRQSTRGPAQLLAPTRLWCVKLNLFSHRVLVNWKNKSSLVTFLYKTKKSQHRVSYSLLFIYGWRHHHQTDEFSTWPN